MLGASKVMYPFLRIAFVLLVGVSLLLPSGSVFGVNVKIWLVVFVSVVVALNVVLRGTINSPWLLAVLAFAALLAWGLLMAVLRGVQDGRSLASQAIALLSVFSVFMLLAYVVLSGALSEGRALRQVATVVVVYSLAKVLVATLLLLRLWSLEEVLAAVALVFGVGFIRLDTGALIRVNFPADFVLPIMLLYMIAGWGRGEGIREMPRWWRVVGVASMVGAIVAAYSRYLWFATGLLLFYWYLVTTPRGKAWHVGSLMAFAATVPILWGPVAERFVGGAAASSDNVRREILGVITDKISEYPLTGRGLGFYIEGLVRIPGSPWYYEFQWLALWMQFGLIGLLAILLLCAPLLNGMRVSTTGVGIALAYLVWLGSGLVNGFLLTSSAGIVFFIYWAMVRNDAATDTSSCVLSTAVSSREGER